MTPYFDYEDIDDPIKYHIDDSHYFTVTPNLFHTVEMYVRKNEYNLHDSIFGTSKPKSGVFYTIQNSRTLSSESDGISFGYVSFELDAQTDQYQRNVRTISDVIGIIGGNYEILRILFSLILSSYTSKMLSYEIYNNDKLMNFDQESDAKINHSDEVKNRNDRKI